MAEKKKWKRWVDKATLFDMYYVQKLSLSAISEILTIKVGILRRRMYYFGWKHVHSEINRVGKENRFWYKYIPNHYKLNRDEIRSIKLDFFRKTLLEDLVYEASTKVFREKTTQEIAEEAEEVNKYEHRKALETNLVRAFTYPNQYDGFYRDWINLCEKHNLVEEFTKGTVEVCDWRKYAPMEILYTEIYGKKVDDLNE